MTNIETVKRRVNGFEEKPRKERMIKGGTQFSSRVIEKLAGEMCDNYCRFPYEYDEENEGMTLQDAICSHCPMNKLEDLFNVRAD